MAENADDSVRFSLRMADTDLGNVFVNGAEPTLSSKPISSTRILVVDDDREMSSMLVDYLRSQGIVATSAKNRDEMARELAIQEPSLIILDLRLERDDGLDLLREIRSHGDTPVIITTGHRRDEIDRVVGLELGADDYLTKPFGLRELLARVRAVLRRRDSPRDIPGRERGSGGFAFADWRLNLRSRQLLDRRGEIVPLTKGEFALLTAFLQAPGRPLTREYLLQATRIHEDVFDRSIDVQVLRLRRRLEADPSAPRVIVTERGIGYRFAVPVERV